jgi:hypothetical protein
MAATTAEVRAWAKDVGWPNVTDRGRLGAEVWSAYASEHAAAAPEPEPEPEPEGIVISMPVEEIAPHDEPEGREEVKPEPAPKRSPHALWKRKPKSDDRPRRKRLSLETLAGLAWQGAAGVVSYLAGPQYAPVSMMMAFQAPVAGAIIEDAAKDTVADRLLQPVARLVQPGGQIGALVGAPVITAMICNRPQLYPRLRPALAYAMREWVTLAGPKLREMKRKEAKFAEEMAGFQEEFGLTVDELLDEIFAPLMAASAAERAAANGHATAAA